VSWQVLATASLTVLLAMWMLGPWPFVVLVGLLAFLGAASRGGKLKASLSWLGVKAELEGDKPVAVDSPLTELLQVSNRGARDPSCARPADRSRSREASESGVAGRSER
jgi:hypothetical protein